ncbi:MAG: CDP-alcohol phosphatidyltransferase family protein [Chlamydiota bacterium]|nr:CDP-alcohol phosphatidyltransferase family protein [Chlamydiota bacterium]
MNLANRITVTRILLTPVFLGLLIYYKNTPGPDNEWLRISAICVFLIAVVSDALDGFVARTRHQKTLLGTYLDPLADKFLILSAIIMLTLPIDGLKFRLPFWFCVLVLFRDAFIVFGSMLIHMLEGSVKVIPSFLGKATTFLQMIAVVWVLLRLPGPQIVVTIAAAFTGMSLIGYFFFGSRQLNSKKYYT